MNNFINFNTDNLIICCYPSGAGGKFLINCLGLSDDAVFQSHILAEKQLNLNFSQFNKMEYLDTELKKITSNWNDLNLGCEQLFGIPNHSYFAMSSKLIKNAFDFNETR